MTTYFINWALSPVLLLSYWVSFWVGITPTVEASSIPQSLGISSGGLKQNRQATPPGRGKGLHDFAPEDAFPDLQREVNNQEKGRRPSDTSRAKKNNTAISANPTPTPVDIVIPPTPAPTAPTAPTAVVTLTSVPQPEIKGQKPRWLIIVSASSFLAVLVALVFITMKLRRQLQNIRARVNPTDSIGSIGPITQTMPIDKDQQREDEIKDLYSTGKASADESKHLAKNRPKASKPKMRYARKR